MFPSLCPILFLFSLTVEKRFHFCLIFNCIALKCFSKFSGFVKPMQPLLCCNTCSHLTMLICTVCSQAFPLFAVNVNHVCTYSCNIPLPSCFVLFFLNVTNFVFVKTMVNKSICDGNQTLCQCFKIKSPNVIAIHEPLLNKALCSMRILYTICCIIV